MWILGSKTRRSFPAFTETFVFNLFCLSRAARLGFGYGSIPCTLPGKTYMVMMFLDQKSRIPQQIQQSQKHGWCDILVGGFNPSEKYERQLGWFFPIYIYGKIKALFQTTNQYYRIAMTVHFFPLPTHVGHPKKRLQLLLIVNLEVSKYRESGDFRNPIPSDINTGIDHQHCGLTITKNCCRICLA